MGLAVGYWVLRVRSFWLGVVCLSALGRVITGHPWQAAGWMVVAFVIDRLLWWGVLWGLSRRRS